jgi:4-hydroxybenzoate polyprenyltransferase
MLRSRIVTRELQPARPYRAQGSFVAMQPDVEDRIQDVRPHVPAGWPLASVIADHVRIARPDHWFKNVFMLPGAALALILKGDITNVSLVALALGIVSTCLLASANYTINEWLDAGFDRHHPVKRFRPSVSGRVQGHRVLLQWVVLVASGLLIAASISSTFLLAAVVLVVMGLIYNVKPIRSKDRTYLDVLTESINNPLRFILGWAAIAPEALPPSSILLAYWMGGAYLMAIKRYAEYRFIGDPEQAALYRRSFQFYTENSLLASAFFYALCSAFFLGVFLIKYRIEFLICMPFLAFLFTWYLVVGMRTNSVVQNPERLYREWPFVLYVGALGVLIGLLFFVDLPWLEVLVESHVLRVP